MKAYYIDIKDDPDQGGHIVWDTTVRNAKKRINESDLTYENWLDIQCKRVSQYDDKESWASRDLALFKWHNAWWWDSGEPTDDGINTDEDFLSWYDSTVG